MNGAYMLTVFSLLVTIGSGQQGKAKMTLLDLGYFSSEKSTGPRNEYQCYLSEPDDGATVRSLRLEDTRPGNNNPDPPDAVYNSHSFPHWVVRFTGSTLSNNSAFGVFGCQTIIAGESTLVPTIRMRSDAEIVPMNGLLTQTVSIGDDGVTIAMENLSQKSDANIRWRKSTVEDGTANGDLVYNISHPITTDDAGIYECYFDGERNAARHALHLLIVRECPAYTWGPPACLGICDQCYNGGVCDENNGKCICPAGFMGGNCETACGDANGFGDDCTAACTSGHNSNACMGFLFCRPPPAGCRCITGYKGLMCDEECPTGIFGASCLQTCHCASGVPCNRYSGVCDGACAPGWTGTNCQECQGAKFQAEGICSGECRCAERSCHKQSGLCSGNSGSQWVDLFPPYNCQTGLIDVSSTKVNYGVTVRVNCSAIQGPGGNVSSLDLVLSNQSPGLDDTGIVVDNDETTGGIRLKQFSVDGADNKEQLHCQLRRNNELMAVFSVNITVYALPILQSPSNVTDKTDTTVTITWRAWNDQIDEGDPPVIGYAPYYRRLIDEEWRIAEEKYIEDLSFTFTGLSPDTNYLFSVAAVREEEGGEGPRSPHIEATTICDGPNETPTDVTVTFIGEDKDSAVVSWELPSNDIMCSTGVDMFTVYYSDMANNEGREDVSDPDARSFIIDDLSPEKSYTFRMTLTTSGGESDPSEEAHILTEQSSVIAILLLSTLCGVLFLIVLVFVGVTIMQCRRNRGNANDDMALSVHTPVKMPSASNPDSFVTPPASTVSPGPKTYSTKMYSPPDEYETVRPDAKQYESVE